jgi:hypothetical protein
VKQACIPGIEPDRALFKRARLKQTNPFAEVAVPASSRRSSTDAETVQKAAAIPGADPSRPASVAGAQELIQLFQQAEELSAGSLKSVCGDNKKRKTASHGKQPPKHIYSPYEGSSQYMSNLNHGQFPHGLESVSRASDGMGRKRGATANYHASCVSPLSKTMAM